MKNNWKPLRGDWAEQLIEDWAKLGKAFSHWFKNATIVEWIGLGLFLTFCLLLLLLPWVS